MENYIEGLNPQQLEAVKATEGRIRVVAGAGSGKTKTLTSRFCYLVDKLGISPAHILCLTFTNKAANEMRKRIAKYLPDGDVNDFICTIHGFCVKILRRDIYRLGYPKSFTILDEEDRKSTAKQILKELELDREKYSAKNILDIVTHLKGGEDYILKNLLPCTIKGFEKNIISNLEDLDKENSVNYKIFTIYLEKQLKNFSLDFDDIIYFALYILKNYDEVCQYWKDQLEYILLDEAQDCSDRQWDLIELLAAKHNNLFIVGDPDQLIYEWRGAKIESFLAFENDKTIILDQNYRSTPDILNVANCIIKNNINRLDKDLFSLRPTGKQIIHFHGRNEVEEMQWVVKEIVAAHKLGVNYRDICILYRASHMTRCVERELIKKHIPYKIYGGIRFYERKEIKDALAYLRLVEKGDDISFLRIINTPSRKLGDVFIATIQDYATDHNMLLYDALKQMVDYDLIKKESAIQFVDLIQEARNKQYSLSISDLLDMILKDSNYLDSLRLDADEERLQNLEELKMSIKYYEEANINEDIDLGTFLQDIALYTNTDTDMSLDAVKLMTIHQAKGLEFPCVFVIQLFDGGLPSYRSIRYGRARGLEEERRLMYVAVTRAENILYLSESEGYDFASNSDKYPSRFLREIERTLFVTKGKMNESLWSETDKLIKAFNNATKHEEYKSDEETFMVNDFIEHEVFGFGKILQINSDNTCKVQFKSRSRTLKNEVINVIGRYGDGAEIDFETGLPMENNIAEHPVEKIKENKNEIEIKKWSKITHPIYGDGVVLNVYEHKGKRKAYVKFEQVGNKLILIDYTNIRVNKP